MELWSKTLWRHIVCLNASHTSVSWILIRPERSRLKSKSGGGRSKAVGLGAGGEGGGWRYRRRERCTLVPGCFLLLSLPPHTTVSVSLAMPSSPYLPWSLSVRASAPPRELEGRGCGMEQERVADWERMRRSPGELSNEGTKLHLSSVVTLLIRLHCKYRNVQNFSTATCKT